MSLLWIIAVILVIAGIVMIVRGALVLGIVLIVLGLLIGPGGVSVFAAEPVTEPDTVQGSLTENHRGTKVTASYTACGSTYQWTDANGDPTTVHDPLARYSATVEKGNSGTATVWAHSIGRLNDSLSAFYGYDLTQDQVALLEELQADYACTPS